MTEFRLLAVLCCTLIALCVPAIVMAQDDVKVTPDVVYGHKLDGITMDVLQPAKDPNGAGVLFMVSGGWRSRWSPPAGVAKRFDQMLENGFTVFVVRHGSSPKFNMPEIVGDVRRAVRYIRANAAEYGVDPDRLGVIGGSTGGHLSLVLGVASDEGDPNADDKVDQTTDRVAAVVAYYPPTDLVGLVPTPPNRNDRFPALNFEPARAKEFSPVWHVSPDDPPTLLIHGDKDTLVPLRHSKNILERFEEHEVPAELIVIEGAGHGFRGADGEEASAAALEWFQKHLLPESN